MKFPKTTNRFCPYCNKKTEQKVKLISTGVKRGTLKRGSLARAKIRGKNRGMGNKGKYSKKAISQNKRKTKTTKKTNMMYTCKVCGKSKYRLGRRNKRTGKQIQEWKFKQLNKIEIFYVISSEAKRDIT